MKFCLIGPVYPYRGGIAHHSSHLASALERNGIKLDVVSFSSQYPSWLYPGKTDKDPSQLILKTPASFTLSPLNPFSWRNTAQTIVERGQELVIFQWWTTYWALAFRTISSYLKKRISVLYIVHNVLPHERRVYDRWLARMTLGTGDHFLVHSAREMDRLTQLIPNSHVRFHPHPTFNFLVSRKIPRIDAREILQLNVDRPVILFFGFVRPYKGLMTLLKAMIHLRDHGNPAILLVAGEIWDDEKGYLQFIRTHQLEDLVRLDNRYVPNEEVGWYFSAADVFAAPYLSGTQSGAITIAKSFNLPVVTTTAVVDPVGSERREALEVIPPNDPEALAQAIGSIIERSGSDSHQDSKILDYRNEWDAMVASIVDMAYA